MATKEELERLVSDLGGKVTWAAILPDGSGAMTVSMPLPKDHWCYAEPEERGQFIRYDAPPMPMRMGTDDMIIVKGKRFDNFCPTRDEMAEIIRKVGRYAYRASTMNGKEPDLDPDALLQNLVVGFLGYWTNDALCDDAWANPKHAQREPK
jgi:hypothetical protein